MQPFASVNGKKMAYTIIGEGPVCIVAEMGLGSVMAEWRPITHSLSRAYGAILLYERAGIGNSQPQAAMRTPKFIAEELKLLLHTLLCKEKLILVAHSQGGLYAQQFTRLYPDMVAGLVLLDPLSADDCRFKTMLTPEEYKKGGVDKFTNLGALHWLAKLRLGCIIRALMKNAQPFCYYKHYSKEDTKYILSAVAKPSAIKTAMEEYRLAHEEIEIAGLKARQGFPDIPLALVTHSSAVYEKEIMAYGGTTRELAEKVESAWQAIMKSYLGFSTKAVYMEAKKSGHFIHLTEPELIGECIGWIMENAQ